MPFEFSQSENLVSGAGIFRVTVTFRRVPSTDYPTTSDVDSSEIVSNIDDLEEVSETANESIDVSSDSAYATFKNTIKSVVSTVSGAVDTVAATVDDIQDEFEEIQDDIDSALDAGADAIDILSQVNNLIRLPAQIIDSTISKVQLYADMASDIVSSIFDYLSSDDDRTDSINNATVGQSVCSMCTATIAEAALYTEYTTREAAAESLDAINDAIDTYRGSITEAAQALSGAVTEQFVPDHDTGLTLSKIIAQTNSMLIKQSFDIAATETFTTTGSTDAITLCWKYYEAVDNDTLEFFITTNCLKASEIWEIPAGREIKIYG